MFFFPMNDDFNHLVIDFFHCYSDWFFNIYDALSLKFEWINSRFFDLI